MFRKSLGFAALLFILSSCGGVEFSGASVGTINNEPRPGPRNDEANPNNNNPEPTDEPEVPPVEPPVPPPPFSLVNWYWKCQTSPELPPPPGVHERVLSDSDQLTEAEYKKLVGSTFMFSGQLCPPAPVKRDVVFVIDVSGSMDNLSTVGDTTGRVGNDLYNNGTCGRLETIKMIAAQAASEDIRFGLVTFANVVKKNSVQMYSNLTDLEASLGGSLADVACAGRDGTNFTAALDAANVMFATQSRADAPVKEIYLVSDGAPSNAAQNGIAQADALKTAGVRIATALLQGNSDTNPGHLRDFIASKDDQGLPLHATVQDAADLAATLAALSSNKIVSASMTYKPIGAPDSAAMKVDLLGHLTGYMFKFEAFKITSDLLPNGLEAVFTYSDKYGNISESRGELKWNITGL